ncbi:MAG: hypothetical protein ACJ74Y_00115 [Bryobacteraceae bacterium]
MPKKPSSGVRFFIFVFGGFVLGVILLRLLGWSWPAMTRPYAASAAPKIATATSDKIAVKMWTGSGRVYSTCRDEQCVRVDFEFRNTSEQSIENLHFVDFKAPGFEETGKCWPNEQHYPSCVENSTAASKFPSTLEPGSSVHVWGQLRPSVATGRFGVLAVYGWSQKPKSGTTMTSHSGSISLQPIEITSPLHEAVGTAERLMQGLLLPILLAFLAYYFQRSEKNREIRRAALEKKQEFRRARLERKRTQLHDALETERTRRHEVWKEQLERMFAYTQEHYSHISRSMLVFIQSPRDDDYRDKVFYQFLMLWLQVRALRERRGGWFFSTKTGEDAFASGWSILVSHLKAHLNYPGLELAVELVKQPESLIRFRKRFDKILHEEGDESARIQLMAIQENFLHWVDDSDNSFKGILALLEILRYILRFEWDRPFFGYWYGESPSFPFEECAAAFSRLPAERPELVERFRIDLEKYTEGVERFLASKTVGDSGSGAESQVAITASKVLAG